MSTWTLIMVLPDLKESEVIQHEFWGKAPVSFVLPDTAKQLVDAGAHIMEFKISENLTMGIPKFSGSPGEAYLKVIKMVDYLNEKMGLLAKYNGYHMEKLNAQQNQALLNLEEPSKMPTASGWVLEAPEQTSGDKVDKTPIPHKSNHQL